MLPRLSAISFVFLFFAFAVLGTASKTHAQIMAQTTAQTTSKAKEKSASGLPLPRFVSIGGIEVNLRTGPGLQYPIDWVYRLKGLPLEIIAEHKTWRKVRDWEGAQGWVHQNMLSGKRTFIVMDGPHTIFKEADMASKQVARAETGVVGQLLVCEAGSGWCMVKADGFDGWMKRKHFWGIMNGESLN